MNEHRLFRFPPATVLVLAALVGTARADAPRVVSTTPRAGDADVDVSLDALRVEFDRGMVVGSHSWVGGGPSFPRTTGSPRWLSPRVCVLPVALEPGRVYSVGINGGRFLNFRAADGTPATPYPLVFRTAGGPGDDPFPTLDAAANRDATEVLRRAIDDEYSHRDRLGVGWDEVFDAHADRFAAATNPLAFALVVREVLEATEDPHVSVSVAGTSFGVTTRPAEPNFDGRRLGRIVPGLARRSPSVITGRFDDGIGYILITTWDRGAAAQLAAAHEALTEMIDAPGIIVDVRPNAGGDELLAQRFAGRFVAGAWIYARHRTRSDGAFGLETSRMFAATKGLPRYDGPVCVLMGGVNMSSCEAFLLMMRQVKRARLVGARSFGSSGNPRPHELGNGVAVMLPSWQAMDAEGRPFEGVGIEPDVPVAADAPGWAQGDDPVIARALEILRSAEEPGPPAEAPAPAPRR